MSDNKGLKYVSIDIETCGLDTEHHDMVEITAIIDDLGNPNRLPVEELPTFHCYVKKDNYVGSAYALSLHSDIFRKISMDDDNVIDEENVALALYKFIDDHNGYIKEKTGEKRAKLVIIPAGKNFGTFDMLFLNRLPGIEEMIQFTHRVLDVGNMYVRTSDTKIPSLNLCAQRAGLDMEVNHTATNEARMVIELIRNHLGLTSDKSYGIDAQEELRKHLRKNAETFDIDKL